MRDRLWLVLIAALMAVTVWLLYGSIDRLLNS